MKKKNKENKEKVKTPAVIVSFNHQNFENFKKDIKKMDKDMILSSPGFIEGEKDIVINNKLLHVLAMSDTDGQYVEVALKEGYDPDEKNSLGQSAIHCALKVRNLNSFEILLNHTKTPLYLLKDNNNRSPLYYAKNCKTKLNNINQKTKHTLEEKRIVILRILQAEVNAFHMRKTELTEKTNIESILSEMRNSLLESLDEQHTSRLHLAALYDYVQYFEILHRHQVLTSKEIDYYSPEFATPLFIAAMYRKALVSEWLMDRGADLFITNSKNESLLHMMMKFESDFAMLLKFLNSRKQNKFNLNLVSKDHLSPLDTAVISGQVKATTWLLNQGVDINRANMGVISLSATPITNVTDKNQQTALSLEYGSFYLKRTLPVNVKPFTFIFKNNSLIHLAIIGTFFKGEEFSLIAHLLKKNVGINHENTVEYLQDGKVIQSFQCTPTQLLLRLSFLAKKLSMMEDSRKMTILSEWMKAFEKERLIDILLDDDNSLMLFKNYHASNDLGAFERFVKKLFESEKMKFLFFEKLKWDSNAGMTHSHFIALTDSDGAYISILLQYGLPVDFSADSQGSLMHYAARNKSPKALEILLAHFDKLEGCLLDEKNCTPLYYADLHNHQENTIKLLEYDLKLIKESYLKNKSKENLDELRRYLKKPIGKSLSWLHILIKSRLNNQLKELYDLGIITLEELDLKNDKQIPLLLYGILYLQIDIIAWMISVGADLKVKSRLQANIFHTACLSFNTGVLPILYEAWIKAGYSPDIDIPTDRGTTPLHVASIMGFYDGMKWLLQNKADPNKASQDQYEFKLNETQLIIDNAYIGKVKRILRDNHHEVLSYVFQNNNALHFLILYSMVYNRIMSEVMELLIQFNIDLLACNEVIIQDLNNNNNNHKVIKLTPFQLLEKMEPFFSESPLIKEDIEKTKKLLTPKSDPVLERRKEIQEIQQKEKKSENRDQKSLKIEEDEQLKKMQEERRKKEIEQRIKEEKEQQIKREKELRLKQEQEKAKQESERLDREWREKMKREEEERDEKKRMKRSQKEKVKKKKKNKEKREKKLSLVNNSNELNQPSQSMATTLPFFNPPSSIATQLNLFENQNEKLNPQVNNNNDILESSIVKRINTATSHPSIARILRLLSTTQLDVFITGDMIRNSLYIEAVPTFWRLLIIGNSEMLSHALLNESIPHEKHGNCITIFDGLKIELLCFTKQENYKQVLSEDYGNQIFTIDGIYLKVLEGGDAYAFYYLEDSKRDLNNKELKCKNPKDSILVLNGLALIFKFGFKPDREILNLIQSIEIKNQHLNYLKETLKGLFLEASSIHHVIQQLGEYKFLEKFTLLAKQHGFTENENTHFKSDHDENYPQTLMEHLKNENFDGILDFITEPKNYKYLNSTFNGNSLLDLVIDLVEKKRHDGGIDCLCSLLFLGAHHNSNVYTNLQFPESNSLFRR